MNPVAAKPKGMDWYAGRMAGTGGRVGATNWAKAVLAEANISNRTHAPNLEYLFTVPHALMLKTPATWLLMAGLFLGEFIAVGLARRFSTSMARLSAEQVFQEARKRHAALLSCSWNVKIIINRL